MGRITLENQAVERSTYVVTLTFTDATGEAVTPDSVKWTLSDWSGHVINSRSDVAATPGATVTIVLSGEDLAMREGEKGTVTRVITIEATYTGTEGAGLPLRDEYLFDVRPLVIAA